jgi:hypothetical protein
MRNAQMYTPPIFNSRAEYKDTKTNEDFSNGKKNFHQRRCEERQVPQTVTLLDDFDEKTNCYFLFYIRTGVIKRVSKKIFF